MKKPSLKSLDQFTQGYIEAMFFTEDKNAPGGMDYRDTGCVEEHYSRMTDQSIAKIVRDCEAFQRENYDLLLQAGTEEQNGMDFWFTRNRHGAGFWDRGYADNVSKPLTLAAHASGERWVEFYKGRIYY